MKARNCNDYSKCSISTKCYLGYSPNEFPSWVLPVGMLAPTPLSSSCGGCAATLNNSITLYSLQKFVTVVYGTFYSALSTPTQQNIKISATL